VVKAPNKLIQRVGGAAYPHMVSSFITKGKKAIGIL